jgi:hypothetical protein
MSVKYHVREHINPSNPQAPKSIIHPSKPADGATSGGWRS